MEYLGLIWKRYSMEMYIRTDGILLRTCFYVTKTRSNTSKIESTYCITRISTLTNMQLPYILSLGAFLTATSAITVSYDPGYDIGSRSLAVVSCSDGSHGMLTKGYTTQGSLPRFPHIGGASTIEGWNSANCGKCYSLTWAGTGKTITVLAIDHVQQGFNIAQAALDELTNGQAVQLGRIDATWAEVAGTQCGLPA